MSGCRPLKDVYNLDDTCSVAKSNVATTPFSNPLHPLQERGKTASRVRIRHVTRDHPLPRVLVQHQLQPLAVAVVVDDRRRGEEREEEGRGGGQEEEEEEAGYGGVAGCRGGVGRNGGALEVAVEEGGRGWAGGGWLVMHCANSPRRGSRDSYPRPIIDRSLEKRRTHCAHRAHRTLHLIQRAFLARG